MRSQCWEGEGDEASVRCWEVILAVTKSTSMANKKQTSKRICIYSQKAIPKDKANNIQNLEGGTIKYPIFLELKFCKSKL